LLESNAKNARGAAGDYARGRTFTERAHDYALAMRHRERDRLSEPMGVMNRHSASDTEVWRQPIPRAKDADIVASADEGNMILMIRSHSSS